MCKCRIKEECPVDNVCQTPDVLYNAKVISDSGTASYLGQTGDEFKKRWRNHKSNFLVEKNKHKTTLSSHIWNLRESGEKYTVEWKILKQIPSYRPGDRYYKLCTAEVFGIIFKKEISGLNYRSEIFKPCPHKRRVKIFNAG